MKIFFDVDGVLINGCHSNSALRKPWDATPEANLGINREAFRKLFFGTPGSRSTSPMYECLTGRRDLRSECQAIKADVVNLPGLPNHRIPAASFWRQTATTVQKTSAGGQREEDEKPR
jgi:hypothetical protein